MFQMWAKLSKDNCDSYHPLLCHMLDVAAVTEVLWQNSLPKASKNRVVQSLGDCSQENAGKLLSFWAALHDMGKASPSFQGLNEGKKHELKIQGFTFKVKKQPPHHGIVTAKCVHALLAEWGYCKGVALSLGLATGGHHGSFPSGNDLCAADNSLGDSCWEKTRKDIFDTIAGLLHFDEIGIPKDLSPKDHPFFMFLSGLISVADWIGSSEKYFPYAPDTTSAGNYLDCARHKAHFALNELGWIGWTPQDEAAGFQKLFPGFNPRPMQDEVINICKNLQQPSLMLIEAPMGEGKTEAAFLLADHWNAILQQRGCYVAMPTQATANAMFTRFLEGYVKPLHPNQAHLLQLLHGQAVLTDKLEQLPAVGAVHNEDEPSGQTGVTEAKEWFSQRKRGLLGPFAVGTVDQALLSVLKTRHVFVRLFGLADKTLVLDEVHAFDTYTSDLIDRLLAWAGALQCSVVLLSATLPSKRRKELLCAYTGISETDITMPPKNYPRITWTADGTMHAKTIPAASSRCVRIEWVSEQIEQVAEKIAQTISDGGCVGWVCNTVQRAQKAAMAMKKALQGTAVQCDLFHARFPFAERDLREKNALQKFGKTENPDAKRPHAAVLIATQVIEQSLDVDFDLLVTDLAPVDLLLQRSGRMHRHERKRPSHLAKPAVWIVSPEKDTNELPVFGPSTYVYGEWLLLRTWITMQDRKTFCVPDDVEALIEEVYKKYEECEAIGEHQLAKRLHDAWEKEDNRKKKLENAAKQVLVKKPQFDDTFLYFTDEANLQDEEDPTIHQAFRAMTRYEEQPSVTLICLHQHGDTVVLKTNGKKLPIDLDTPPDATTIKNLLNNKVTITHAGVTQHFHPHEHWAKTPLLRYACPAVFDENGILQAGKYVLRFDDFLGIVIESPDSEENVP